MTKFPFVLLVADGPEGLARIVREETVLYAKIIHSAKTSAE